MEPNRARYIVAMDCGHSRATEYPPLDKSYTCGPCGGARAIAAVVDTELVDQDVAGTAADPLLSRPKPGPHRFTIFMECGHTRHTATKPVLQGVYPCNTCHVLRGVTSLVDNQQEAGA